MSEDMARKAIEELYLADGKKDINEFYSAHEDEIAGNATSLDGEIVSAIILSGKTDKSILKLIFPSVSERRISALRLRGLFAIRKSLIASFYPLFGEKSSHAWRVHLDDVVKTVIGSIEVKELHYSERKMNSYFSSDLFCQAFPSMERNELLNIVRHVLKSLEELGILKKERLSFKMDMKRAYELIALDSIRLSSYIIWPNLDHYVRKKSFYFLYLLKKIDGVKIEDIGEYVSRASLISGFSEYSAEDLFYLLLLIEQDGFAFSPEDDKAEGPAIISSDFSISFIGSYPAQILLMASAASIDRMKIFRMTKESMLNAFSNGYKAEEIISFLESLSSKELPEMLTDRIRIWNEEYSRIRIERALVLSTDEKSANIIRNIPALHEYIMEELSPTVFIMDAIRESEWREILHSSSFDMLSQTKGPEFSYEGFNEASIFIEAEAYPELREERVKDYDGSARERLLRNIDDNDNIDRAVKEAMVKSGIIFRPDQIERKLDFPAADAFNYQEKHKIIESCLKDRSSILFVENHSGKVAAGKVQMLESYEEGDHMVLSRKVLNVSRLYRVKQIPEELL